MLIFLITNLVVLPVSIAFFYDDPGVHWIIFNITCDTMFILDIVINFRTGISTFWTIYSVDESVKDDIILINWWNNKIILNEVSIKNSQWRIRITEGDHRSIPARNRLLLIPGTIYLQV